MIGVKKTAPNSPLRTHKTPGPSSGKIKHPAVIARRSSLPTALTPEMLSSLSASASTGKPNMPTLNLDDGIDEIAMALTPKVAVPKMFAAKQSHLQRRGSMEVMLGGFFGGGLTQNLSSTSNGGNRSQSPKSTTPLSNTTEGHHTSKREWLKGKIFGRTSPTQKDEKSSRPQRERSTRSMKERSHRRGSSGKARSLREKRSVREVEKTTNAGQRLVFRYSGFRFGFVWAKACCHICCRNCLCHTG